MATVSVSIEQTRVDGRPMRGEGAVNLLRAQNGIDDVDAALVSRCRESDLRAFEVLVERHKDKIHNFVCRMVNNPDDAEDITQEVFIKVFRKIRFFRGDSTFLTWLYRIALNHCVDMSRKLKRQPAVVLSLDTNCDHRTDAGLMEIPDEHSDPHRELEREELRAIVQQALARLSPKLRSAVVLYDIQGLSYEEMSQVLGVPIGTIKSRLFNGRAELAKRLRSYVLPCGAQQSAKM